MGQRILRFALIVVAVVATVFIVRHLNDPQRSFRESGKYEIFETEGHDAPPFGAKIVGEDRSLTRDDLDRPAVFVFFATFCPHCKEQMPIVREVAQEVGDRAYVYAVNGREYGNLPIEDREKKVVEYLREHSWEDIPTLIAPEPMQSAFKIGAVPTVVVIDRARKIHYVGLANHSASRLEELIEEAM